MNKLLFSITTLTFVLGGFSLAYARENGATAKGYVSYVHPEGQIVDRECEMWVPAMGQGAVKLTCQNFAIESTEFTSRTENGRRVFSVVFKDVPGAPAGAKALYEGTYMRGSNKAYYYGDVYAQSAGDSDDVWNFAGGFMFSSSIQQ
jgi:hypothetical protein